MKHGCDFYERARLNLVGITFDGHVLLSRDGARSISYGYVNRRSFKPTEISFINTDATVQLVFEKDVGKKFLAVAADRY